MEGCAYIAYKYYAIFDFEFDNHGKVQKPIPYGYQGMTILQLITLFKSVNFSVSSIGEGNGNPLQYSWPRESQGWGSLVGCRL